jgi:hypothetical protein
MKVSVYVPVHAEELQDNSTGRLMFSQASLVQSQKCFLPLSQYCEVSTAWIAFHDKRNGIFHVKSTLLLIWVLVLYSVDIMKTSFHMHVRYSASTQRPYRIRTEVLITQIPDL